MALSYEVYLRAIRRLPTASGVQHDLTESFGRHILPKFDLRYCNVELLYCAYYFLNKAELDRVVRECNGAVILACKDWINNYLDHVISTAPECPEARLVTSFRSKYSKKVAYTQRRLVLDIVRYIDMILSADTSGPIHFHNLEEPKPGVTDLKLDSLRMYTSNEHLVMGPMDLAIEELEDAVDLDDDDE